MKILLIDDNLNRGWKQILYKIFPIANLHIEGCISKTEADLKISDQYDLIFLDMRLSEEDHTQQKIEDISGFKILRSIKNDFSHINFSTPIILLTASNKIWNVDKFKTHGIDSYYIKEHPDYSFDKVSSRQNLLNFQKDFAHLQQIGPMRRQIWSISNMIIDILSTHHYFEGDKKYVNVKERIIDKLMLGYNYMFTSATYVESEVLKVDNESLSFIVIWSILEEVVKGCTDINHTWTERYERTENWKFRNGEYFFERINGQYRINCYKDYPRDMFRTDCILSEGEFDKRFGKNINLSDQVYSIIHAYSSNQKLKADLKSSFRTINKFRNEVDFIHSNVKSIHIDSLISKSKSELTFKQTAKTLKLILDLLKNL